jgi:hypothetical protein
MYYPLTPQQEMVCDVCSQYAKLPRVSYERVHDTTITRANTLFAPQAKPFYSVRLQIAKNTHALKSD